MLNPYNDKPILACDFDDCITNLVGHWLSEYNRQYDDNLTVDEITDWDIGKFTKISDKMYFLLEQPNFFKNVEINEDCYDVLKWASTYFDVQIISATNPKTYFDKVEWLKEHLPFIPPQNYNCVTNKYIISGAVMIDDKPENLEGFKGKKILFTRPWNQDVTHFNRADNWQEIRTLLELYLKNTDYLPDRNTI
jgi:5'(3')-deoxyribonucleotidase